MISNVRRFHAYLSKLKGIFRLRDADGCMAFNGSALNVSSRAVMCSACTSDSFQVLCKVLLYQCFTSAGS